MDEDLRRMAREQRSGLGRHQSHIGTWVVIDGVRTSYRGVLTGVLECGGGVAILYFDDMRALEALADPSGEVKIGKWELYSHAVLGIGPMPATWAK